MAIRRLTGHVSSAREKNQDVGNEDVTGSNAVAVDIYKWGFQEPLPNL